MNKNSFLMLSIFIFLFSGCASYYTLHINNFYRSSIYSEAIHDLDNLYNSFGIKKFESEAWVSNVITITHKRINEKLLIRVIAFPRQNDEEAQIMADYIKQYLLKNYSELNIEVKKETSIDLR